MDRDGHGLMVILFADVLGWCGFSPIGEPLSHIEVASSGHVLDRVPAADGVDDQAREARFVSAWSDEPVLVVAATKATVLGPNAEA